jgi:hypothetical protein
MYANAASMYGSRKHLQERLGKPLNSNREFKRLMNKRSKKSYEEKVVNSSQLTNTF